MHKPVQYWMPTILQSKRDGRVGGCALSCAHQCENHDKHAQQERYNSDT